MQNHKSYVLAFLIVLVLATMAAIDAVAALQNQNTSVQEEQKSDKEKFESQFPIVEYIKPEPSEPDKLAKRRAVGKKHNREDERIGEHADTIVTSVDWEVGLPALPVARSRAVVIGQITHAEAYLSTDKTGVYSEFTILIDKVLKNESDISMVSGAAVVPIRSGGRVRFPSGHVTLQYTRGQGMPRIGKRYVFFLTRENLEHNLDILTGYELKGGRVALLDYAGDDTHPRAKYKKSDETSFLKDLQAAITNPTSSSTN